MTRLKLVLVVILTAAISAALTSFFWVAAFNRGPLPEPAPGPAPAAAPVRA